MISYLNSSFHYITYHHSALGEGLEGRQDYLVNIYNTGDVYYNYPTVIEVLCKIDVTYFPFDLQVSNTSLTSLLTYKVSNDMTCFSLLTYEWGTFVIWA